MARVEKKPVDREELLARLARCSEALRNPPTFNVGDLLTHNPDLFGPNYARAVETSGAYPVYTVIVTHDSYRETCIWVGNTAESVKAIPESQALYIAAVDADGDTTLQWVPARSYILAPRELISIAPAGSLNH